MIVPLDMLLREREKRRYPHGAGSPEPPAWLSISVCNVIPWGFSLVCNHTQSLRNDLEIASNWRLARVVTWT